MGIMPDTPQPPGQAAVKSAVRALDLLEVLARRAAPMTHAELAVALGMPKSSLTLLLRTLADRRYLAPAPDGRGWRIGPAVAALGGAARRRIDLADLARPVVSRLSAAADESAGFVVREGDSGRVLVAANAEHPLTYAHRTGQLLPLHATSSGKAMLAALPEAEREAFLATAELAAFTPDTVTSPEALRAQLEEVRATGTAHSFEERHRGIVGMAKAVLGHDGGLLGAVNVALPSARFTEAARLRIRAALDHAAKSLAIQHGGGGAPGDR